MVEDRVLAGDVQAIGAAPAVVEAAAVRVAAIDPGKSQDDLRGELQGLFIYIKVFWHEVFAR